MITELYFKEKKWKKITQLDPSRPHGRRGPPELVGLERRRHRRRRRQAAKVKNVKKPIGV